ncbi:4197_t:CDS:1, partial [Racocetra fulgida]
LCGGGSTRFNATEGGGTGLEEPAFEANSEDICEEVVKNGDDRKLVG